MVAVLGIIADVLHIIKRIERAAEDVRGFPEASSRLATRCRRLERHLERLRLSAYVQLFEIEMKSMKEAFEEAEAFLIMLGQASSAKLGMNHAKFAQQFKEINTKINESIHDLCLGLNIQNSGKEPCLSQNLVEWDIEKAPSARSLLGGTIPTPFQSYNSQRDTKLYYSRVHTLCSLHQATRVEAVRICLANLDPGDTTYAVRAGKIVGKVATGAPLALPRALLTEGRDKRPVKKEDLPEYLSRSWKRASDSWTNKFLHFLVELDLTDGTTCTLERCADDVYLYAGESSRQKKRCVMSSSHVADVCLGDLIRIRNEQRKIPYKLNGNNCIDFAWESLCSTLGSKDFFIDQRSADGKAVSSCQIKSVRDFVGRCRSFYQSEETATVRP